MPWFALTLVLATAVTAHGQNPDEVQVIPPLEKPAAHGSPLNGGIYSTVDVLVIGCQGRPVTGTRVLLAGEQEAEEIDLGVFRFTEVPPGTYRLYAYAPEGTTVDTTLVVSEAVAEIRAEVMIDVCIGTSLTIFHGVVKNRDGKPTPGATVSVPALFLQTTADKKGRYELRLPPGEWEVVAEASGGNFVETVHAEEVYDYRPEPFKQRLDFRLP